MSRAGPAAGEVAIDYDGVYYHVIARTFAPVAADAMALAQDVLRLITNDGERKPFLRTVPDVIEQTNFETGERQIMGRVRFSFRAHKKRTNMTNRSGIHINPKNKGKFTATKKKTGKTTEELEHSSNPLTRKRAVFAENAKKWHHGGSKKK